MTKKATEIVAVSLTVDEWRDVCGAIIAQAERFEVRADKAEHGPDPARVARQCAKHLRALSGKIIDHGWDR